MVFCLTCLFGCSSCNEEVEKLRKCNFEILVDEYNIEVGASQNIVLTCDDDTVVSFHSENTEIATVDSVGKIVGIGEGVTHIEVSTSEKTIFCKVNVTLSEYSVVLGYTNVNLVLGSDLEFTAQLLKNGVKYDGDVIWSISPSNKSELKTNKNSAQFLATAVGNYVITATSDKANTSCNIKVVNEGAKRIDTPTLSIEHCDTVKWEVPVGAESYAICINNSEWVECNENSFSIADFSNHLKHLEEIDIKVKCLSKDNFDYIDSYISSLYFHHEYNLDVAEGVTCTQSGLCTFTCELCNRSYRDENYYQPHVLESNICKVCGQERTPVIRYLYDEEHDCYYVAGLKEPDATIIYVAGYFDDGLHGKKEVKYIGSHAFLRNIGITHIFLPENIYTLYDQCFAYLFYHRMN